MIVLHPTHEGINAISVSMPIHMLIGFALELYLKAWLLAAGVTSGILRSKEMGHNLQGLYESARSHGMPDTRDMQSLIDLVHKYHAGFDYRYMKEGTNYTLLNYPLCFEILNRLDEEVDGHVGASASLGLTVGRYRKP